MNPWVDIPVTIGLIVASAFFVIIEFALLGARRHRLEETAATSASSRAALRSVNELTIMLAGAQLGITACTFALGAITKPAAEAAMSPLLDSLGLPGWLAGATAFTLSLLLVTFLHLVVGEMAPKSWAIAHPELAARVIALPARGFIWVFRPLLMWVNAIANRLVARTGVTPVESAAVGGQDAATIRQLVEHSAQVGVLEEDVQDQISEAIEFESQTVGDLVQRKRRLTSVPADATAGMVRQASWDSGHLRILVDPAEDGALPAVVHVRDTLLEDADRPVRELHRTLLTLRVEQPVVEALEQMRSTSTQFSIVMDGDTLVGVLTLSDILRRLMPQAAEITAATRDADGLAQPFA